SSTSSAFLNGFLFRFASIVIRSATITPLQCDV
ncbi:MAG: hypothetical protein ACI9D1_001136, partial [Cryomorphaceae bacterium]